MATTSLYIPGNNANLAVIDISTITAPTEATPISLPSGVSAQSVAIDSIGNIFVADKAAGRVYKLDPAGTLLLNQTVIQSGEGPKSIVVDDNDSVWAFFGNSSNSLKLFNATLLTETTVLVAGDIVGVGAATGFNAVIAYDNITGNVYRINTTTNVVDATFDLVTLFTVPGTAAFAVPKILEIAAAADKVYVVVRTEPVAIDPYCLVVIDLNTNSAALGDTIGIEKPNSLFTNGTYVFIADEDSRVHKFSAAGALIASFNLTSAQGDLIGLAMSDDPDHIIVLDNGFFPNKIGYHIVNINTGLTVFSSSSTNTVAGNLVGGDYTGFQRLNNIGSIILGPTIALPTIDPDKVFALVRPDGRIDIVGLAGALTDTTSIDVELVTPLTTIIIGIVPRVDKGFSGISAVAVGLPEGFQAININTTGPGGTTSITINTFPKVQRYGEQVTFENATEVQLNELIARSGDILGTKLSDITDFTTWGGFVVRRLQDIYRLVNCLQFHISSFKDIQVDLIDVLSETQQVFQGDTPTMKFTVVDFTDRSFIDITGAEITLNVFDELQGVLLIFQRTATVIAGSFGAAEVVLNPADTAQTGEFAAQLRVTFPGGEVLTTPRFRLSINPTP